ncbi:hypothetical protein HOS33_gp014 [Erwinia phage vB_EamM_Y3]|uniref:Uncharacterized protein n=1 Tax=Erwinia phage vB_EamM_Y3 TaxID=1983553 RepID=A0A2H4IAT9_9CAUD|nr:hypothetical protein HOS33_gp014 [Erwinia phage vB_EamM_Y3]ARW58654.1 hypothetical protein Y3_014 [Erwinia phage vB_EamM_Y3]QZE55872.1 hypothetical protein pEaSNUABM52_00014 [Erwinia phage pEp_SNUABM_52]
MNTIRGFDWLFYGDGTDSGQNSITSVVCEPHAKSMQIEIVRGCARPVIQAIQENDILYVQIPEGLYRLRYACSFRKLDSAVFPQELTSIKLKLVELDFLAGVTTHDKTLG